MRLAVIPGDGIGPEVVAEGLKVLRAALSKVHPFSTSQTLGPRSQMTLLAQMHTCASRLENLSLKGEARSTPQLCVTVVSVFPPLPALRQSTTPAPFTAACFATPADEKAENADVGGAWLLSDTSKEGGQSAAAATAEETADRCMARPASGIEPVFSAGLKVHACAGYRVELTALTICDTGRRRSIL